MEGSNPGGYGPVQPATEEVQEICDKVSSASFSIISFS